MSGDFDKAIDRAVREMLDVEPRADLRARVLRQIAEPAPHVVSAFTRKAIWLGVPLASAAALVLALLPWRHTPQPPQPEPAVATRQPAPMLPAAPQPPVHTPDVSEPARTTARATVVTGMRARPREAVVTATALAPAAETTEIEPLGEIAPIHVAPVAERRIVQADITVRQLNPITELQIAPLTPPGGRD